MRINVATLFLVVGGLAIFGGVCFRVGLSLVPGDARDSPTTKRAGQAVWALEWGSKWFPRFGLMLIALGLLVRLL
jgi:hypothetical protein